MRGLRMILVVAILAGAGCQKPPPPRGALGPPEIKGRALDSDGNPLVKVSLVFLPQDEVNKGTRVICLTQPDGSFVGRCSPGRYKVTLAAVPSGASKADKTDKDAPARRTPSLPFGVPARYGSATETPWEVEVPADGKSDIVLKVEAA